MFQYLYNAPNLVQCVICMGGHISRLESFLLSCTSTQPWPPPEDEAMRPVMTSGMGCATRRYLVLLADSAPPRSKVSINHVFSNPCCMT